MSWIPVDSKLTRHTTWDELVLEAGEYKPKVFVSRSRCKLWLRQRCLTKQYRNLFEIIEITDDQVSNLTYS